MLNIDVDIDLIVLFVRLNLLAVIDIDCQVKRLVVNFLALHLRILRSFPVCLLIRTACGHVLVLRHGVGSTLWSRLVDFFLAVEVVTDVESLPALFGKAVIITIHFDCA
jgi:hypothetical protein